MLWLSLSCYLYDIHVQGVLFSNYEFGLGKCQFSPCSRGISILKVFEEGILALFWCKKLYSVSYEVCQ